VPLALDDRVFGQIAQPMVSCAALHALVVDHVALALDERVCEQIAQLVVFCDSPLALLVGHVAFAPRLDASGFGRGAAQFAQLVICCDTLHALAVDHVARALDERGFARDQCTDAHKTLACTLRH